MARSHSGFFKFGPIYGEETNRFTRLDMVAMGVRYGDGYPRSIALRGLKVAHSPAGKFSLMPAGHGRFRSPVYRVEQSLLRQDRPRESVLQLRKLPQPPGSHRSPS